MRGQGSGVRSQWPGARDQGSGVRGQAQGQGLVPRRAQGSSLRACEGGGGPGHGFLSLELRKYSEMHMKTAKAAEFGCNYELTWVPRSPSSLWGPQLSRILAAEQTSKLEKNLPQPIEIFEISPRTFHFKTRKTRFCAARFSRRFLGFPVCNLKVRYTQSTKIIASAYQNLALLVPQKLVKSRKCAFVKILRQCPPEKSKARVAAG